MIFHFEYDDGNAFVANNKGKGKSKMMGAPKRMLSRATASKM